MNYSPKVLWFTGLSGSGKTFLATQVARFLSDRKVKHTFLDGDVLRQSLYWDLGYSDDDRRENIRRVGEIARALYDGKLVVVVALISPFRGGRAHARNLIPAGDFIEIYVDCPLEICRQRDPKGLYQAEKAGMVKLMTGISSVYEPPENPEITLETARLDPEKCVERIIETVWPTAS
jgi:adenylyl-sulfate kinase